MSRKSILPNSSPQILAALPGKHGTFQVRLIAGLDDHGLFFGESLIAIHNNGYSCHNLAERIIAAWENKGSVARAMEQFDYILRCGGLGKSRESVEWIASGAKAE